MRLSLDVIQDCLSEEFGVRRYGPATRESRFGRPLLYVTGMEMKEETLYVAWDETLPAAPLPPTSAVICVGSRSHQAWWDGGGWLLEIRDGPGVLPVFNAVQNLFNLLDAWDEALRDELERDEHFDIRHILELGVRELKRSITVSDHALRTIFLAEPSTNTDDISSIRISDSSISLSVTHGERIKEMTRLERNIQIPYLSSYSYENDRFYCCNLYPMGSFSGCVSIAEGDRPFRDSDFFLMDHFFSCFQKAFGKYLRNCGQTESPVQKALRELLENAPAERNTAELLLLEPGDAWVCFQLRELPGSQPMVRESMTSILNGTFPDTIYAVICRGAVQGLIRVREQDETDSLPVFEETLLRMGYVGGVSNPFSDLNQILDYMRQAVYAVERGRDSGQPLNFFQNHALSYLIDVCTREMPTGILLPRGLIALRRQDEKRGTKYLHTLDMYLQKEMRVTQTAEALYIHRSSLLKRLEQIRRLLGDDDLAQPETRLYYRICLAMLKQSGSGTPSGFENL